MKLDWTIKWYVYTCLSILSFALFICMTAHEQNDLLPVFYFAMAPLSLSFFLVLARLTLIKRSKN